MLCRRSEVLGLPLLPGGKGELAQLGHAVHQLGDLLAELGLQLGLGGAGVLEDVVQEPGRHGRDVHLEIHEEGGDFEGVGEVRLAGGALLTAVRTLREPVGALQHRQVRARLILRDLLDQRL